MSLVSIFRKKPARSSELSFAWGAESRALSSLKKAWTEECQAFRQRRWARRPSKATLPTPGAESFSLIREDLLWSAAWKWRPILCAGARTEDCATAIPHANLDGRHGR